MKENTSKITMRAAAPEEESFWKEVFFDAARERFSIHNLAPLQLDALLEMQYAAQRADYERKYPRAENNVILYGGEPVGRAILSTESGELHLADIAVLSRYRNLGIGTEILNQLFRRSRRAKMPVTLFVERHNRAVRLYEKLGFKITDEELLHFRMEWRAAEDAL